MVFKPLEVPEIVPPDETTREFIRTVLEQNKMVLEMNKELMEFLAHPILVYHTLEEK